MNACFRSLTAWVLTAAAVVAQDAKPAAPAIDTGTSTSASSTTTAAGNTNMSPATGTAADALSSLSPEDRRKLQALVSETLQDYRTENYDQALTVLDKADAISPKNVDLLNLRGAIFLKQKKWDQAIAQFNSVLAINPKYFSARFNIGEVPYQQKKYAEARTQFQKMLADDPKNELLLYKIYLTYLMEQNLDQAQAMLAKMTPFGNTPAYYFATAAWHFNRKEEDQAESYVSSSIRIYDAPTNSLFAEPLIEAGWLKRATQK